MVNPFKAGYKVITHLRGGEVEGVVRMAWVHEVQIRVPSEGLIWRTMKKVRMAESSDTQEDAVGDSPMAGGSDSPDAEDHSPDPACEPVESRSEDDREHQRAVEETVSSPGAPVSSRRSKRERKQGKKRR